MNKALGNSLLALAAVAAMASPIGAQVPVPPLPHLEIRIAHSHPPRPHHEVRTARPGSDYVWIGGSWDWQGSEWTWIPGRWERPEHGDARWVHPRYVHEYGAYRYEPGHWSYQRVEEGDEYHRWREEHRHHHAGDHDHDHDHDHP